jgi:hypothetical protein
MVKNTQVSVKGDSQTQTIRELFDKLRFEKPVVVSFITQDRVNVATKELMSKSLLDMTNIFDELMKANAYNWNATVESLKNKYNITNADNNFLSFLFLYFENPETFGKKVEEGKLETLKQLCSEIKELDETLLNQLFTTYCKKYNFQLYNVVTGGRGRQKLSRRRKSNLKSKSKHNHKRRSHKKSSYRRQRH